MTMTLDRTNKDIKCIRYKSVKGIKSPSYRVEQFNNALLGSLIMHSWMIPLFTKLYHLDLVAEA